MTRIEWTDAVWNPVTGCSKVSAGCKNCYAERMAKRLRGRHGYPANDPFRVTLRPDRLNEPFRWKGPRRVFVNSMSDLFHEDVPDDFVAAVFFAMSMSPQHISQILTKRLLGWSAWEKPSQDRFLSKRDGDTGLGVVNTIGVKQWLLA